MQSSAMRILVIGKPLLSTHDILRHMADRGWGALFVSTVREARDAMKTFEFDVTLAAESLPDGRGYDLTDLVTARLRSLFVAVVLSESCLWLPVVFRGAHVLGQRAIKPQLLEMELETLLSMHAHENARDTLREISPPPAFVAARPGPERSPLFRRKYRDRDTAPMER
jgi:hypothetical protein